MASRRSGDPPGRGVGRIEVSPTGFLLAGLSGAWIAHNLEYLRVWGTSVFPAAASRSAHVYMGPAGLVLVSLALVAAHASFRAAGRLQQRLSQLRRAMVGGRAEPVDKDFHVGLRFSWSTFLGLLWLWQLLLYLAQENLEARALGLPLPWFGAMSGVHALAPAVHLAVALAITLVVWLLRRRIVHLTAEVRRVASRLAARRQPARVIVSRPVTRWWTPAERWGVQLWSRPPPVQASA